MAQRYYFDLSNGSELIRDVQGVEAGSLREAIIDANAVLEELRNDDERLPPGSGWLLIIRDDTGATLKTLTIPD